MERIFNTLIKKDHVDGENEYIQGRISGIQEIVCDGLRNGIDEPCCPTWDVADAGKVIMTICEPEKYETFKNLVDRHYPGLCEFDYSVD